METIGVDPTVDGLSEQELRRRRAERELARPPAAPSDEDEATRRSRFLVSMGHTLRTPLNAVLGFSEVLQQAQVGSLTERQRGLVDRITEAGQRQLGIIDNLIDLARIHAGETTLEPRCVDSTQLVDRAVSEFSSAAKRNGVELSARVDDAGAVEGDPELLQRALGILVGNAVRYTGPGGTAQVTAGHCDGAPGDNQPEQAPAGFIRIEVSDTGPGILPEDQPLLFDDFEHADSLASRRERRSGVGLALARRIVELHGGRIAVESSGIKGEGSRFYIELPGARPHIRSEA